MTVILKSNTVNDSIVSEHCRFLIGLCLCYEETVIVDKHFIMGMGSFFWIGKCYPYSVVNAGQPFIYHAVTHTTLLKSVHRHFTPASSPPHNFTPDNFTPASSPPHSFTPDNFTPASSPPHNFTPVQLHSRTTSLKGCFAPSLPNKMVPLEGVHVNTQDQT